MIRHFSPRTAFLMVAAVAGFCALMANFSAWPQHNHAQGHQEYKDWQSQKTGNCCSDRDCHGLADGEWRETSTGTQIKIAGTWCQVERQHFIIRGRSPDWNVPHACIAPTMFSPDPCQRLLCFSGKGGF